VAGIAERLGSRVIQVMIASTVGTTLGLAEKFTKIPFRVDGVDLRQSMLRCAVALTRR
jgi:hypothetical protein